MQRTSDEAVQGAAAHAAGKLQERLLSKDVVLEVDSFSRQTPTREDRWRCTVPSTVSEDCWQPPFSHIKSRFRITAECPHLAALESRRAISERSRAQQKHGTASRSSACLQLWKLQHEEQEASLLHRGILCMATWSAGASKLCTPTFEPARPFSKQELACEAARNCAALTQYRGTNLNYRNTIRWTLPRNDAPPWADGWFARSR